MRAFFVILLLAFLAGPALAAPVLTLNGKSTPVTVLPGAVVSVGIAPVGSATDWMGLYKVGTPDTAYTDYAYAKSASLVFGLPSVLGTYEFRLFANNSYIKIATSPTVTIAASVPPPVIAPPPPVVVPPPVVIPPPVVVPAPPPPQPCPVPPAPVTPPMLDLNVAGNGSGTVYGLFVTGTDMATPTITIVVQAASGSRFTGFTGDARCSGATIALATTDTLTCTATFTKP